MLSKFKIFSTIRLNQKIYATFSLVVGEDGYSAALHHSMFTAMIQVNADAEQSKEWLPPALNGELLGTYAQTELGHGTNLKRLETTATFDATRDEFVLHSPTLTSTKFWPGNLGANENRRRAFVCKTAMRLFCRQIDECCARYGAALDKWQMFRFVSRLRCK